MKRRAPTSVRQLKRSAIRALSIGAALLCAAALLHWAATPYVGNARAAGWVSGFIRQTDAGYVHWNPENASTHIGAGFTDWSPDLIYDGEPLPDDVVARYWCEYKYEREKLWSLAPLVERATVDLRISDPNFAPASPALVRRYRSAAAIFVFDQVRAAREANAGAPPFWTHTFAVADVRLRNGAFWRIYWIGAPAQCAVVVLLNLGVVGVLRAGWLLWRLRRAEAPRLHPLCPRCLYDVSGQDVTACPECAQALDCAPAHVTANVIVRAGMPALLSTRLPDRGGRQ